ISSGGGLQPLWGPAGSNELFYWDPKGTLKAMAVTTTAEFRVGPSRDVPLGEGVEPPSVEGAWNYAVSPLDGRFLMLKPVAAGNALVSFKVVVNWFEEFKRL